MRNPYSSIGQVVRSIEHCEGMGLTNASMIVVDIRNKTEIVGQTNIATGAAHAVIGSFGIARRVSFNQPSIRVITRL